MDEEERKRDRAAKIFVVCFCLVMVYAILINIYWHFTITVPAKEALKPYYDFCMTKGYETGQIETGEYNKNKGKIGCCKWIQVPVPETEPNWVPGSMYPDVVCEYFEKSEMEETT